MWTEEVNAETYRQHLRRADEAPGPLSIYIHLPFCRRLCTYCGCSVVVTGRQDKADSYLDYLEREFELICSALTKRRSVSQLHLGGGTPTFLDETQLARLWRIITERFSMTDDAEVALEVDPVVTRPQQLELLATLGFNRISMGVQDFAQDVQEYVGRPQTIEQTQSIFRRSRELGYRGINFDLIYGLPKQRAESFAETVDKVVEMRPDRVAAFSYAHVPWIRPHQRKFDESLIPQALEKVELYRLAHERLLDAGYIQVGMDHFALPDDELAIALRERRLHRNFQGYTVRPATELIGLGITAIGDVAGCYAQNVKKLSEYYRALEGGQLPTERGWVRSPEDDLRRTAIHKLMCDFELDLEALCESHGVDANACFASDLDKLDEAERDGLIHRQGLRISVSELGQLLVRNVAMAFDRYLGGRSDRFSKTI